MHLVTAVVRPHKLDDVKEAIHRAGLSGMTVTEARGVGRQGGHTETYRGAEYTVDLVPKLKIEILVPSGSALDLIEAITKAAATGRIGDGKIWAVALDTVTRVRTGEMGEDAL